VLTARVERPWHQYQTDQDFSLQEETYIIALYSLLNGEVVFYGESDFYMPSLGDAEQGLTTFAGLNLALFLILNS
jgi:hypothetical protein